MILKICLHAATMQSPPLLRGRAMAVAVHHAEIFLPGPSCFTNLVGHDARDLVQVVEIVRRPCGQQLAKRSRTKRRMLPTALEVFWLQIHRAQLAQLLATNAAEFVEQLMQ